MDSFSVSITQNSIIRFPKECIVRFWQGLPLTYQALSLSKLPFEMDNEALQDSKHLHKVKSLLCIFELF